MQRTFLLYIVVAQGPPILQLLSCKNQPLLIGRDALFILNFGFDIFNSVGSLDIKGDGLQKQGGR